MHIPTFIEHKRDGHAHPPEEIAAFISSYAKGELPDYQAAAWAMAVYFKGMSAVETSALTRAMRDSGRVCRWPAGSPRKVDKHSTGGVGDKVSLPLAPLLACAGVWVPMISGRGLGITGGTLDKLESIPGFRVSLSEEEALAQLQRIGVAMMGQSADLCPADKKLYALRDVTATVPSIPAHRGEHHEQKARGESRCAGARCEIWQRGVYENARGRGGAGERAVRGRAGMRRGDEAILNPMEEPLGHTAGNALEVWESVETLHGRGPVDLVKLTLDLAEAVSPVPRGQLEKWLIDGTAWRKVVRTGGGAGRSAPRTRSGCWRFIARHRPFPSPAPRDGTLRRMDAESVGRACVALGAGRARASDAVDFAVGCSGIRRWERGWRKGSRCSRFTRGTKRRWQQRCGILSRPWRWSNGEAGNLPLSDQPASSGLFSLSLRCHPECASGA
jgi:thymidine phosphorylase